MLEIAHLSLFTTWVLLLVSDTRHSKGLVCCYVVILLFTESFPVQCKQEAGVVTYVTEVRWEKFCICFVEIYPVCINLSSLIAVAVIKFDVLNFKSIDFRLFFFVKKNVLQPSGGSPCC